VRKCQSLPTVIRLMVVAASLVVRRPRMMLRWTMQSPGPQTPD
jgi:hypothetical protein